jgi:SAM-dependent methyltransferase
MAEDYRQASQDIWDQMAAGWDADRRWVAESSRPVAKWLVDALDPQPGETILELAAGVGDTGLAAASRLGDSGRLISTDFSAQMVDAARRRAEELGASNVEFRTMDAERMDLADDSIDGVVCRWGYMLMADPENALRETRRVLRPGGRVALAAWAEVDANPWSAVPGQELVAHGLVEPPEPGAPGQYAWARHGLIGEVLDAAGFGEHHVEPLDFTFDYRSAADWWRTVLSCSNRLATAVAKADDNVVDAIAERLDEAAEAFRAPDGTLRVPARTWVAWAAA